jgi:hypothetical protein
MTGISRQNNAQSTTRDGSHAMGLLSRLRFGEWTMTSASILRRSVFTLERLRMACENMSNGLSLAPFPFPGGNVMPADILWTPARIREKILSSDVMLERSIVKIYEHQTYAEQNAGVTVEHNGVGFTAFDAEFMSSLATRIRSSRQLEGARLSAQQRAIARNKMVKYAKQLSRLVNGPVTIPCPECEGDGGRPELPRCSRCEGRGTI